MGLRLQGVREELAAARVHEGVGNAEASTRGGERYDTIIE